VTPFDYLVLAFGCFMSSCAVLLAFARRIDSLALTGLTAAFWTAVVFLFTSIIRSLLGRGVNVTIFDPSPGLGLLLLLFLALLLPVAVLARLMGRRNLLAAIAVLASGLSALVGGFPVLGLVSYKEMIVVFDVSLSLIVFLIGVALAAVGVVNIGLGFTVIEQERKKNLEERCLALLKARGRATYPELQSHIKPKDLRALDEALNHLMMEGMVEAQKENGETYFAPCAKPEA